MKFRLSFLFFLIAAGVTSVYAKDTAAVLSVDKGDTAWLLVSTALVMLMISGPCSLLRRNGKTKKCTGYNNAEFHCTWRCFRSMGANWL